MTVDATGDDGWGRNPDLEAMQRDLIALGRRLEASLDVATTVDAINAISDQILEVDARATASGGRVLLAACTEEIARHAQAVATAIPDVEREIEDLGRFERTVVSVPAVLDAADEAVRVVTLVCR